jgi:hypothetical protein
MFKIIFGIMYTAISTGGKVNKLDFLEYQHIKVKLACSEVKNTKTHIKAKHTQIKNLTQWQMKRLTEYCRMADSNG